MSISTTAFLRILPTAMWRPGAAEHGVVLEPRTATVPLTAIGTETVIDMTTVMDIMTVDCIVGGTNTIAMTTMTAIGIMIAVVTTAIGSTTATRTVTMIAKSNKALLSQRARRITKNLVRIDHSPRPAGNAIVSSAPQLWAGSSGSFRLFHLGLDTSPGHPTGKRRPTGRIAALGLLNLDGCLAGVSIGDRYTKTWLTC